MQISFNVCFMLLLCLITYSTSSQSLLRSRKCVPVNEDCDITHWCCAGYYCRDFRCSMKGVQDNILKYTPEGIKCSIFYPCQEGFECVRHRCIKIEKNSE